jgi:hypothetical protein
MRIDEVISLKRVLKSSQYIKLLRKLRVKATKNINVQRIKNRIIQSWKRGMKHRSHFDTLLREIDTSVDAILQEDD